MVQRKETNKPNREPREAARSRGGGSGETKNKKMMAMKPSSRKPDPLPNYMKPTSSSGAKKEQQLRISPPSQSASGRRGSLKRKPSMKRGKETVVLPKLNIIRATCSSTLKDSKFPMALELSPGATEAEGTAASRVCPYLYCPLNGHSHDPLPPLKSCLSSRRKLMRAQQSMKLKLKGSSPFRSRVSVRDDKDTDTGQSRMSSKIAPLTEEIVNDFFVEIYVKSGEDKAEFNQGEEEVGVAVDREGQISMDISFEEDGKQHSDLSVEQMDDSNGDQKHSDEEEDSSKPEAENSGDQHTDNHDVGEEKLEHVKASDMDSIEDPQGYCSEYSDDGLPQTPAHKFESDEVYSESLHETEPSNHGEDTEEPETEQQVEAGEAEGSGVDEMCIAFSAMSLQDDECTDTRNRVRAARKPASKESKNMKDFNPGEPRFLPVEPDPEADHVDLRHMTMDEKKNVEEWMIDYALQKAVTKLAPARNKKVALLVEAFETVTPIPMPGKAMQPETRSLTQSRPVQACS